jgi:hypothetical protein
MSCIDHELVIRFASPVTAILETTLFMDNPKDMGSPSHE